MKRNYVCGLLGFQRIRLETEQKATNTFTFSTRRIMNSIYTCTYPRSSAVKRPIAESSLDNCKKETTVCQKAIEQKAFCEAYSRINHSALLLLQLDDTTLNTVFNNEFDCLDRTMLTQPMDTIHSLCNQEMR